MKNRFNKVLGIALFVGLSSPIAIFAQEKTFKVTVEEPDNGSIKITPTIPEDGLVKEGTVLKIKTTPDDGFSSDGGYFYNPGEGMWTQYHETMKSEFEVVVDREKVLGASFIESDELEGFKVTNDVVYAKPGVKELKYDVFSPEGAKNLPGIVIIHGGGWSSNTEDIMRGMARELVKSKQYVVFSIDYRWIGQLDGDKEPNTMGDLIEDVYGAIAHIQEHAKKYGCDPTRIAVTGDSAGGHLSASAANMVDMIGDGGFGEKEGVYEYKPTYLPKGKSVAQVRKEIKDAIKVAAPSYGVFEGSFIKRFSKDITDGEIAAISPIESIPNIEERAVPQYLIRGTTDFLIKDKDVQKYADALEADGQTVKYVQVEGAGHAFFDWKPDATTKETFAKYGKPYIEDMKQFFDAVFYPGK